MLNAREKFSSASQLVHALRWLLFVLPDTNCAEVEMRELNSGGIFTLSHLWSCFGLLFLTSILTEIESSKSLLRH